MDASQWGEPVDGVVVDEPTPAPETVSPRDVDVPKRRSLGRAVLFGAVAGAWSATGIFGRLILVGMAVALVLLLVASIPTLAGVAAGFLLTQPAAWPVLVILAGWGIARRLDGDRPGLVAYLRRLADAARHQPILRVAIPAAAVVGATVGALLAVNADRLAVAVYTAVGTTATLLALTAVIRDRWSA